MNITINRTPGCGARGLHPLDPQIYFLFGIVKLRKGMFKFLIYILLGSTIVNCTKNDTLIFDKTLGVQGGNPLVAGGADAPNSSCPVCATCLIPPITHFGKETYCESRSPLAIRDTLGPGSIVEIGNTITSIIGMSIFGALGLWYTNYDQDPLARILYSILFWNGFGSAVYHGSGLSMLGSLDGIPMLILICIGMNALFDEIVHEYATKNKNRWKGFISMFSMLYLLVSLMAEQYGKGSAAFRVLFALPMGVFALTMIFLYVRIDELSPGITISARRMVRELFVRGWISGIGAFSFWLLDLFLCIQSKYFLLIGHWLWHIGIAYFGSCLVCAINFLRGNNQDRTPVIRYIWNFIPISYYAPPILPQSTPPSTRHSFSQYTSPTPSMTSTRSPTNSNSTW